MLASFRSPSYRDSTTCTLSGVTGAGAARSCACAAIAPATIATATDIERFRITATPSLVEDRCRRGHRRDEDRLDPERLDRQTPRVCAWLSTVEAHQHRDHFRLSRPQRREQTVDGLALLCGHENFR